jgi:hypothetical protein
MGRVADRAVDEPARDVGAGGAGVLLDHVVAAATNDVTNGHLDRVGGLGRRKSPHFFLHCENDTALTWTFEWR